MRGMPGIEGFFLHELFYKMTQGTKKLEKR